jgi:hypothetical protein
MKSGFQEIPTPKRYLGKPCLVCNHHFQETGKSLRLIAENKCCYCLFLKGQARQKKNPEHYREATRLWRQRHPERYKKAQRLSQQKRIKNDPAYRIHKKISNGLRRELVKGDKKGISWLRWAGYTAQELKEYLEKLFRAGMSWDNYGTYWVIDHIIPRVVFKYISYDSIEFRMCWALPNLQPMIRHENEAVKRDRLDYYSEYFYNSKLEEIKQFVKEYF